MSSPNKKKRRVESTAYQIERLPIEIVATILEYIIDPKDRCTVRRTCREWQGVLNNIIERDKSLQCIVCNKISESPHDRAYVGIQAYTQDEYRMVAYRPSSPHTLSTVFQQKLDNTKRYCFCTVHRGDCYNTLSISKLNSTQLLCNKLSDSFTYIDLAIKLYQLRANPTRFAFYTPVIPQSVLRITDEDGVRCVECTKWIYRPTAKHFVYCDMADFDKGWILPVTLHRRDVSYVSYLDSGSMIPLRLINRDKYYFQPNTLELEKIVMFYCNDCTRSACQTPIRCVAVYAHILRALEQLRNLKMTHGRLFKPIQALECIAQTYPMALDFLVSVFSLPKPRSY